MTSQAIFDYERVLTPIGFVWVPVVRVRLRHGGNALDLDMTVDSGADLTMLPYQVGLNLGFRKGTSHMSSLSGIAGRTPFLLKKAGLEIGTIRLRCRVAWAQTDDVPILLGRCDVFDRLTISFNGRERRVTFNG
jgi:hypothetical protein